MGIRHRILNPNVSLVVAATFLVQILPFGNAVFASPAPEPTTPPLASVSPSPQGKRLVEANSIFLARSDGWEPLNKAGSGSTKIAPPRETNGKWAPIRNERPVTTPVTPSKSAEGLIGNNGGIVADAALGVQVTIGPKSLTKPTRISISPVQASPPLVEGAIPEGFRIIRGPAFDLGPSGLVFQKPVQVTVRPSLQFREYLKKGARLEVGYWNGKTWQPVLESRSDDKGTIYFETDHFTIFTSILTIAAVGVGLLVAAVKIARWRADTWLRPWNFITPKSPKVISHAKGIKLPDPDRLSSAAPTSLNLKSFSPRDDDLILVPDGETMLSRKKAYCWGLTNYVSSVLLAKKNPHFTDFICVSGKVTNNKGETGDHAWIEIKIKDKLYVVDTLSPTNICLIPKDIAYKEQVLIPDYQWTQARNSRKAYVGWGEKTEPKKNKPAADADGYDWSYSGSAQDLKDYKTKQFSCNVTMATDVPGVKVVKETAQEYNFLIPCKPIKQKYTFTVSATVDKKPVTPIFTSACHESDVEKWNKNDIPYQCTTEVLDDNTMKIELIFDHSTFRWQCTSGYVDFLAQDNMSCGRVFLSPDINQLK